MSPGFWRSIRDYANKRLIESVLDRRGNDVRCPWCKRWMHSETSASIIDFNDGSYDYECHGCGGKSTFLLDSPVPIALKADDAPPISGFANYHTPWVQK